uniref:Pyridoxamine 5'-phosphate oxidase Alr4036 family FMN-binding domain-containing protein n=1 Tax=Moniliophthora roreri TaxID=221103 RepID=A0A0W0FXB7_MONRR
MTGYPRWKTVISDALSKYPRSVVFQLATMDDTNPLEPQVRSHIFRGFITPPSSTSKHLPVLLLTSTDIRTPKVKQMMANPHVQIHWYIEDTREQFRIAGLGRIIPSPEYKYLCTGDSKVLAEEGFDWEAKRVSVFKSLSPHMRASWCRPPPGSILENPEEEIKRWPPRVDVPGEEQNEDGSPVSDEDKQRNENWETALSRFALVLIDPKGVDYLNMGVVPNRRYMFRKGEEEGEWGEMEIVA